MSHYKPKAIYRTNDASRWAHDFYEALQPWVADAIGGRKRHRIASPNTPSVNRAADDLLCDCAAALAESPEWEGALLASKLAARGWPVDVELVRACHTWSCGLMDRIMSAYRHRSRDLRGTAA